MKGKNPASEHYQGLRVLSCERLWAEEVPAFDRADARDRVRNVAVVRAVGVVFSESGTPDQKADARRWLLRLLDDPQEKVRRYAMNALPKIGADAQEEVALHSVLRRAASDREKKSVGRALERIGGAATLEIASDIDGLDKMRAKVEANVARARTPSTIPLDRALADAEELRIHLRCRAGLERILEDEVRERSRRDAKFRLLRVVPGMLALAPTGALALGDVYALRCFSTAAIGLGNFRQTDEEADIEALAGLIASPLTRRVLEAFTEGPLRYRLEFVSKGHQRGMVRRVAARVYELCPRLLNDSRDAPWQIDVFHKAKGIEAELAPRLRPDPRFAYRRRDVPAASHPPLAACMARLAGGMENETVWDPFCGSGLELIEAALRGNVRRVIGTDRSAEAIAITGENFAAALPGSIRKTFASCDFRSYATVDGLGANAVSLVLTNPPLGRRVPIPNLRGLIADLFAAATEVLEPGGRLVFVNPLPVKPVGNSLRLEFRQKVDLGGFNCHLEKYRKAGSALSRR